MISEDLLFVVSEEKKCILINVNNYQIVQTFYFKDISSCKQRFITASYFIKGKYVITCGDGYFGQYKIKDNSLNFKSFLKLKNMYERYPRFLCLGYEKNGKILLLYDFQNKILIFE